MIPTSYTQFLASKKTLKSAMLVLVAFILGTFSASAQLVVDPTATNAAMSSLIEGSGLTISNFTITSGAPDQYGTFTYTPDGVLGLDEGLLLTTGDLNQSFGPNNTGSASVNQPNYTDPDIVLISPLATNDAVVIEFDVVPKCDTIQIDFVFASEEYNEYVCSSFNDAFAFFVSGPGIAGPYAGGAENFAILPDGTDVSIGTVNNGSEGVWGNPVNCGSLANGAFFVDNAGGADLQYDGYTIPLSAKGVVQPCETYHVKLVIADAGDGAWDSAVYLKSFSCPGQLVDITADPIYSESVEGCQFALFYMERWGDITVPLDVDITIGGSATYGVDYILFDSDGIEISSPVTFGPDDDQIAYILQSFGDTDPEILETVTIQMDWWICTELQTANQSFDILDPSVILHCDNDSTIYTSPGVCGANFTFGYPYPESACGVSLTRIDGSGLNSGDFFPVGTTTLTWDAITSIGGESDQCSRTITVIDNELPTITCGSDVSINTDAGLCTASVSITSPTATDNCGILSVLNDLNGTSDASDVYPIGVTSITWTAIDVNGNISTCVQMVTVTDPNPSTLDCPSDISIGVDSGACEATGVALGSPIYSGFCAPAIASATNDAPATFPLGTTVVNWTITDSNGVVFNCAQNVTVVDDEGPVFTCPTDVIQGVDVGLCAATVSIPSTNPCANINTNGFESGFGIWNDGGSDCQISWSNPTTGLRSLRLRDNSASSELTTDDLDLSAYTSITIDFSFYANGMESGEDFWLMLSNNGGSSFSQQEEWDCDDEFVNGQFYTEQVVINGPFSVNTQIRFECDASQNNDEIFLDDISISGCSSLDVCSSSTIVNDFNGTNDASGVYPIGTTTVVWTATDGIGNITTCSQLVTVNETENPTISCPSDIAVGVDTGICTASSVALGTPTTADNCGVSSVVNDAPAAFALGTTTVTWTVTDNAGNTAQCTQSVVVTDDQNPTISCPSNVSVSADAAVCTATGVALGTPTTNDNCGIASTVNDAPATYALGATTVTWTVTDNAGNTAQCTQTVTVLDTENPTISCSANVSTNADAGICTSSVALIAPSILDNCGVASLVNDAPGSFPIGTTTVTWTVTDNSGNTAQCAQSVTVIDSELPTILCPSVVNTIADFGSCDATG
ncbi:MAG: hypothetical protein ACI943_002623, partial [Gammaproteobacteria bacterium]